MQAKDANLHKQWARWLRDKPPRNLPLVLILVAALMAAYWAWARSAAPLSASLAVTEAPKGGQPRGSAAPVRTVTVEKRNFPVYLNGLGTVQATNTVTVRSRVDGQITRVGFEEGQMVQTGDLLVQIDPAPFQAALGQATAKLAQDQATLKNAEQDLQRTQILAKQGNATQQLLDQRTATVANQSALVQADQAAIESAKIQLAYTSIASPLTGRAGFRLVDPGNIIHASDQGGIVTITQLQPISVVFTAPEQELPAIQEALSSGPLPVTALRSDGGKVLGEGKLQLLDNQVDVASGTIKLKATFENPGNTLWPGLSVTTRLLVRTIKDVVVVPDSAVQRGPSGLFAYVVTSDARAELRNLKVSRIEDGQALVEAGLSAGERIVTAGHYRVQPGGPVQVVDSGQGPTATVPAQGQTRAD
jgi:membrane fusion protein, multidrug efflux system